MYHSTNFGSAAPAAAIRATIGDEAARLIASRPFDLKVEKALDKHYGRGRWFMYYDEDLSGHPIRGTVTLAFGSETLIVG